MFCSGEATCTKCREISLHVIHINAVCTTHMLWSSLARTVVHITTVLNTRTDVCTSRDNGTWDGSFIAKLYHSGGESLRENEAQHYIWHCHLYQSYEVVLVCKILDIKYIPEIVF